MTPLVTIGIPTYDRSDLIGRALAAVASQDYPSLEVLVADNASPGDETRRVVDSFRERIPGLTYVRHATNIGALNNFMFLLGAAKGQYFMWLADDDELSANYVRALVELLESDSESASAAGHWMLMRDANDGQLMATASYPQASALARVVRFVWRSDDAFFYALHRTDVLREASFPGYWWPNRKVLLNWAYPFLIDVVLRGRVLLPSDRSVQFMNHDYTPKDYRLGGRSPVEVASRALRRINVHYLYWAKCARVLPPVTVPVVIATSVLALVRDAIAVTRRHISRRAHEA